MEQMISKEPGSFKRGSGAVERVSPYHAGGGAGRRILHNVIAIYIVKKGLVR